MGHHTDSDLHGNPWREITVTSKRNKETQEWDHLRWFIGQRYYMSVVDAMWKCRKRCSKFLSLPRMHALHRRSMDWRTRSNAHGFGWIIAAAQTSLAITSTSEYIALFSAPQRKKSMLLKSKERIGQRACPPRSIHGCQNTWFKCSRTHQAQ